jgi:hypothetical protein
MLAAAWGVPVEAQSSKAFEVCAKAALQQAMLVRSVIAQTDLRDRSGAVIGTKVDLDVNALGKKTKVSCFYTAATRAAVIDNTSKARAEAVAVRTWPSCTAMRGARASVQGSSRV